MGSSRRSVGVIIPSYGPLDDAARVLADLADTAPAARTAPAAPQRILVIDDAFPGGIDESVLPGRAELIRREENGGFGAAVNTGLRILDEDGIDLALVLNSDLQLPPNFLPDLLEHAEPWQPAVIGCRNETEDGHSGYAARHFPTVGHQVVEWLHPLASQRHRRILHTAVGHDMDAEAGTGMIPVDWVSGAVMLLPVAEVMAAGGLEEDFFMYTEEVDLQKRLAERGIARLLDADLTVVHAGGGSSGGEERRRGWLTSARDLYAARHLSTRRLRAGLTAASVINLGWNSARRAAGRDVRPLENFRFEMGLLRTARAFTAERTRTGRTR
ncbi:glycosyltransferase [Helcobacillus massiliensis]|uniref:glycosyltransferase n=1 Tax=Helcobacillus TaxID=1161125 RepID=UPI001EF712C9|nr:MULTISPECIES: glycosyltransferase [Helcobacillus]MCG7427181.1 glycosyltransferase [Helcobacillus sp. ACRRO]MCT1556787.1 glycosyltransferase [Helcobacillus massiliensis]MCT2035611.1 glycosyltransferase [Helcobacillus massiliensis]MCT2330937.1 glycosyltransferase [Helcobacillus massiliensis]